MQTLPEPTAAESTDSLNCPCPPRDKTHLHPPVGSKQFLPPAASQFSSVTQLCPTLCNPMNCIMPGLAVHHQSWSLLKLMAIESVMPSNHLILCHPLLLPPSILPTIKVFSNESVLCIRWPKYWSYSISPSSEYSGLISFRIDWPDLLAVHETLKSSPAPRFESTSLSVLSLLYDPNLRFVHDH